MTREEAVTLYSIIKEYKNGTMSKALIPYAKLRLKLRSVSVDFDAAKKEFKDMSKPKEFNEKNIVHIEQWNKAFKELLDPWLKEESGVTDNRVFTFEEAIEFCNHNSATGSMQDEVLRLMVSEEAEQTNKT